MILVSGKSESGKDVVAEAIMTYLLANGFSAISIALGDLLKFFAIKFYGWDGTDKYTSRDLLFKVSDRIHEVDYDLIVRTISVMVDTIREEYDYVIISDLRFKNEYCYLTEKYNCVTIRVEREGYKNSMSEEQRNNISEVDLDNIDFDYYINKTELSEKYKQTYHVLEEILNG